MVLSSLDCCWFAHVHTLEECRSLNNFSWLKRKDCGVSFTRLLSLEFVFTGWLLYLVSLWVFMLCFWNNFWLNSLLFLVVVLTPWIHQIRRLYQIHHWNERFQHQRVVSIVNWESLLMLTTLSFYHPLDWNSLIVPSSQKSQTRLRNVQKRAQCMTLCYSLLRRDKIYTITPHSELICQQTAQNQHGLFWRNLKRFVMSTALKISNILIRWTTFLKSANPNWSNINLEQQYL